VMKLALILGFAQALTVQEQYEQFLKQHGRPWRLGGLQAFADNLQRTANSSTLGITPFSDLTAEEFRTLYLRPDLNQVVSSQFAHLPPLNISMTAPPPSIDWRTHGVIPPVISQGQSDQVVYCIASDNLVSVNAIAHPPLKSPIPVRNMLMQCAQCKPQADFPCVYNFAKGKGICTSFDGSCDCPPDLHLSSVQSLKGEDNLLNAVALGPVSAYVNAAPWQSYIAGILTGPCSTDIDHAVLVVGYGTEAGTDYWTLKNTWGTSWGEHGYIRIKRGPSGPGECGVAVGDFFPVVK